MNHKPRTEPRRANRERDPRHVTTIKPVSLTEAEAARYLGNCRSYLRQDRMHGPKIPYVKVGRMVRYLIVDLDAHLDAHRVSPDTRPAA